jgi:hypothetical protein
MPFDDINVGTTPNDGTGDTLRVTGQKVNANFDKAVEGPASAVDNRVASFDGVTGKLIQDSGLLSTELATVNAAGTLSASERLAAGLWLPGTSGNYASAPDSAALDVTGDLDVRAHLNNVDGATNNAILATLSVGGGFTFAITTAGFPRLYFVDSGGTVRNEIASVSIPSGVTTWLRATLDVDDGAGSHVVKFYTSDDGVAWSQLGVTRTGAGTGLLAAVGVVAYIGRDTGSGWALTGTIYRAQVYDGIDGTLVADFDSTSPSSRHGVHPSSFTDSVGNVWTVNGSDWEYRDDLGRTLATAADTRKAFVPPRMTTTTRNAITNLLSGTLIYNITTNKLNFWNGSAWEAVTSA